MMPINFNLKKDYIKEINKKDYISDKLDFRKKLDSYSKKNDNKDINMKNEKRVLNRDVKTEDKEEISTESKDVKKQQKDEISNESKDVKTEDKEEISTENKNIKTEDKEEISTENKSIDKSEVLDIDKNEDIDLNEKNVKEDLENVMSILQSLNIEIDNQKEIENIQKNINELIEKIDNGQVNIEDFKDLLIKLEDAEFIPTEVKSEILSKLELIINQKNVNSKYIERNDTNVKKGITVDENTKEEYTKIEDNNAKQESLQNKNSNQINKDLNQNTSYNQNEDLDNINKNFLIKDKQDETENDFNFQNLNIGKITNGIKASTGVSINNKPNNIDSYNIINQIVKNSKIITDKNNSSIQMQLEPEHLGKLTLKIVLERGILSANFIAENDEVKTIIEGNMEELKNNLSEQGINIQSLSVSVDSQGDLNKHKNILEAMAYNKKISKNIDIELEDQSDEIQNPYLFEDDNFNGLV